MNLFEDVGTSVEAIDQYLNAQKALYARRSGCKRWEDLDAPQQTEAAQDLCSKIYDDLSILDGKASGLIASNAIVTAIFALIALAPLGASSVPADPSPIWFASMGFVIVSLVALILNVLVLNLYWSTTSHIRLQAAPNSDPFVRTRPLIERRNKRTRKYRIAYLLHIGLLAASLVLFLVLMGFGLRIF
jgi:hypothetical protein